MAGKAILTAALTGPIATKQDNPHLPCSPEEIAAAAKESFEEGASIVHVHLRDEKNEPTADLEVAKRVVGLIEEACPALIQLSTGVGMGIPYEERIKLLDAKPRMATLNVCSMTFGMMEFLNPPEGVRRMAARMQELGIKPELELYDTGHLDVALSLLDEGLLEPPLQFSLVLGIKGGMSATPANIAHLVSQIPEGSAWQVIGIGRVNVESTTIGLASGGNARTGMEDTLMLRRGEPATSNRELIARLAGIANAIERPIANVQETEEILQLK